MDRQMEKRRVSRIESKIIFERKRMKEKRVNYNFS